MSWPEVSFEALYSEDSRNGVYKPKEYQESYFYPEIFPD